MSAEWFVVFRNTCDKCCMAECDPSLEEHIDCNCNNIEGLDCEECAYKEVTTPKPRKVVHLK